MKGAVQGPRSLKGELLDFVLSQLSSVIEESHSEDQILENVIYKEGKMPATFKKVMKNGVPVFAVLAISIGIFIGVILNIVLPMIIPGSENIFVYVYSASILPGMIPWFMILMSHIQFRKKFPERIVGHPFKMPGAPVTNYLTIGFLVLVLIGMPINPETRISVIIGILFLSMMAVIFFLRGYHKMDRIRHDE